MKQLAGALHRVPECHGHEALQYELNQVDKLLGLMNGHTQNGKIQ